MYELNRIEEVLKTCAKMQEDLARIDTPEFAAQYAAFPGDAAYAARYGAAHAIAGMAAREAERAIAGVLAAAKRDVALLERLQAVMERFEVFANIDWQTGADNTRELKLLEVLTTDARWRSDVSDIKEVINDSLSQIEDSQWEEEQENAVRAIEAAGFEMHEDGEIWHRSTGEGEAEAVTIQSDIRGRQNHGYKFEYVRNGHLVVVGNSGQFALLVAQIAPPVGVGDLTTPFTSDKNPPAVQSES